MDVQIEREELPRAENVRENDTYWNNRYWWQKMLDRLRGYEHARRRHLLRQAAATGDNSQEFLQILNDESSSYKDLRQGFVQIIQELEESTTTEASKQK